MVCHPWMWWTRKIRPFNVTVSFLRFPSLESTITTIPQPQVSMSFLNVLFVPILCIPQFIRFLSPNPLFLFFNHCFDPFLLSVFWSVSYCGSIVRGSCDSSLPWGLWFSRSIGFCNDYFYCYLHFHLPLPLPLWRFLIFVGLNCLLKPCPSIYS